jgi:hypothetical protein
LTAAAVAAAIAVPQVLRPGPLSNQPAAQPSIMATVAPSTLVTGPPETATTTSAPSVAPPLALAPFEVCPSAALPPRPDGELLPSTDAAAAAARVEGPLIAPGMEFAVVIARTGTGPNLNSVPRLDLVVDVGDAAGWGSVSFQIFPQNDLPPEELALRGAAVMSCVDGSRYDFGDGSVAIYYPYGPPEQEATVTHVWYFAAGGFTMNIGMFPEATPTDDDGNPDTPAIPSPRPARGEMPLTIGQVMQLAHAIAQSR